MANSCNPLSVVANAQPKEGNRTIPALIDWTVASSQVVDLQSQKDQGIFSSLQGVWVDNRGNTNPVLLSLQNSQQVISCPANGQGFFQVISTGSPKVTISSAATTGSTFILFFNFPVVNEVWDASGAAFSFDSSGNLLVSDAVLAGTVQSNNVQTLMQGLSHGSVIKPNWLADRQVSVPVTAAGSTTLLAAPGSGVGHFIKEIIVRATANVTTAVAAVQSLTIDEGAEEIASCSFLTPTVAGTLLGNQELLHIVNYNWNSKTANTLIAANLSNAITAGNLEITLLYGTTTTIG